MTSSYVLFVSLLVLLPNLGVGFGFDSPMDFDDFLGENKAAELRPNQVNLFVGDVVEVFGILTDPDVSISDVFFLIELKAINITLPKRVVNSTHVAATLEGTEVMKGIQTLSLKKDNTINGELKSLTLYVLDRLQNVTNVSSTWNYFEKTLDVQWHLPVDYASPVFVETKWVGNNDGGSGVMSCAKFDNTFCHLNATHYPSKLYFHMIVTVKDFWWDVYKDLEEYFLTPQVNEFPHLTHFVNPRKHVKSGKPTHFKVRDITSRYISVSWTNPDYFRNFKEDTLYHIAFKNQDDVLTKDIESVLKFADFGEIVTIHDLDPDTFYMIHLRVKPLDWGYWSETATVMDRTLEDRPEYGPLMTNTSFWLGMCKERKREAILYWKDLKPNEANGVLTNFHIYFNSVPGQVRHSSNYIKADLDCNVTYNVEVFSSTKIGLTHKPSRLTIPAEKDVLKSPFSLDLKVEKLSVNTEANQMAVNVSWAIDKNWKSHSTVSLVLYYCQGQTFSNELCLDDFKSKVVPLDSEFIELYDVPLSMDRFGYALQQNEDNLSGITWTDCIYDRHAYPRQVTGVRAIPGNIPYSINVVWNGRRCSKDTKAFVLLYHIHYCTESGTCREKEVPGSNSSYLLTGLDADKNYTVSVSAESFNAKGPASQFVTSRPARNTLDDDSKLTVVIIAVILSVIILAFVVFCFWKIRNHNKRMKKSLSTFTRMHSQKEAPKENNGYTDSGISTCNYRQAEGDPYYETIGDALENSSVSTGQEETTLIYPSRPEMSQESGDQPIALVPEESQTTEQKEDVMDTNTSNSSRSGGNTTGNCVQSDEDPYCHMTTNEDFRDAASSIPRDSLSYSNNDSSSDLPLQTREDFNDEIIDRIDDILHQNSADGSSCVTESTSGGDESYPNSNSTDETTTNKTSSSESSGDAYVLVTNMENTPINQSSDEGSDDYVPPPGQTDLFHLNAVSSTTEAGQNQCSSNILVSVNQVSNQSADSSSNASHPQSNDETCISPYNLMYTDGRKDGCAKGNDSMTDNNSATASLSNQSKSPPLCERKISEDEGISSPSIFSTGPDFSVTPFAALGQTQNIAFTNQTVSVDVSNIRALCDSDIEDDDNTIPQREEVSNNSDGYTNPIMLERGIYYSNSVKFTAVQVPK